MNREIKRSLIKAVKKLRVRTKLLTETKTGYTYRNLLSDIKSGKLVSIPELLQRILPKDVWTNLVRNSYMNENFIFTGCSELQAFRTMTKQALLNSLEHDVDIALTDNNADFIQEAVDIINSYTDAEEFIIDGQSRSLLALVPFFDGKFKFMTELEIEDYEGNIVTTYTNFYFTDLSSVERDCILDQVIDMKTIVKGSLIDAAALVIGMNTNNPFSQSGMNWLIWFDEIKFKISDEIINHYGLPILFSKAHIGEDSNKYKFSTSGHIQFMFEVIHLIKNINTPSNYNLPDAGRINTILNDKTVYTTKLLPNLEEYELLKICMGTLADIQLTKIKIPKYANAMNLIIKYQLMFNPKFERGQELMKKVFPNWVEYKTRIHINDRKAFAKFMIELEINSMSINENEVDSDGNLKRDSDGKTITDREGIKWIMQSTSDISRMKKRFKLIEGFMENILLTLKDRDIISIVQKRRNSDSWYAVYDKTKGTQEDMYGRPITDLHYLENKSDYDIGHIISNRDEGEETLDNKELEDAGKNRSKGARNY